MRAVAHGPAELDEDGSAAADAELAERVEGQSVSLGDLPVGQEIGVIRLLHRLDPLNRGVGMEVFYQIAAKPQNSKWETDATGRQILLSRFASPMLNRC